MNDLEDVGYVKTDDGWKKVRDINNDIPEECKDNYFYRAQRHERLKQLAYSKNDTQEQDNGKSDASKRKTKKVLRWIVNIVLGMLLLFYIHTLVVLLNPDSCTDTFVEKVIGVIVYGILQVIVVIYKIFYSFCEIVFNAILIPIMFP